MSADGAVDEPRLHRRRSIRLRKFDYASAGAYFVTICTRGKKCFLGDVVAGAVRLTDAGRCVDKAWEELPNHYPNLVLDVFVVMPNHVHGIVMLNGMGSREALGAGLKPAPTIEAAWHDPALPSPGPAKRHRDVGAGFKPAPGVGTPRGLTEIVRAFKTFSARRVNALRGTAGSPLWQRNYYEHVIRDDRSLAQIRDYITTNPARWAFDSDNPDRRADARK